MFYSTKIKSLGAGGAIDVNGRWLRFIGRLPVKEGDTVYTDGNVIFARIQFASIGSVTGICTGCVDERDFGNGAAKFQAQLANPKKNPARGVGRINFNISRIFSDVHLR